MLQCMLDKIQKMIVKKTQDIKMENTTLNKEVKKWSTY